MRIKFLFFFAALVLAGSCIESFRPPTTDTQFNYLIVSGFLINGEDSTIIKLSRTQTLANKPDEVREFNARVQIEEDNGTVHLLDDQKNGSYAMAPMDLSEHAHYRIRIKTSGNKEYVSDFVPLRKSPPIDELYRENTDKGVQISLDTHDPENEARFYFWTYKETWKFNSIAYSGLIYENGEVIPRLPEEQIFECWKTTPSNKLSVFSTKAITQDLVQKYNILLVPYESRKLYYEYSVLVKQHILTEEGYRYWVNTIKNSENLGSIYASIPSQVIGNIYCLTNPSEPVIGYFGATSVTQKRISFNRQDIPGPSKPYESAGYEGCTAQVVALNYSGLSYVTIISKKYDEITGQLVGYSVGSSYCVDCRTRSGTTVRPPFWD